MPERIAGREVECDLPELSFSAISRKPEISRARSKNGVVAKKSQ